MEDVVDKIKGLIYGQAIGDAFGLATEFFNKQTCKDAYGPDGPKGYEDIVQDLHRNRWKKGDWTDDTDQMLLILQMIIEHRGKVDVKDFARKMKHWAKHGIEEHGDIGGMGIGSTTVNVLRQEDFEEDPCKCAKFVWEKTGCVVAPNGGVMRTSILGALCFNDIPTVINNTRDICRTTHYDPRCVASCVAVTTAVSLMLRGKVVEEGDLEQVIKEAMKYGEAELSDKKHKNEFRKFMSAKSLAELKLDDKDAGIGYTFRCMATGFYGLSKEDDFKEGLTRLIMEGGDADTNGAVYGALVGCRIGFKALPEDLLCFPHREWLDKKVNTYLQTIGLRE
jgi:ADP-ribosylglycohydrolase